MASDGAVTLETRSGHRPARIRGQGRRAAGGTPACPHQGTGPHGRRQPPNTAAMNSGGQAGASAARGAGRTAVQPPGSPRDGAESTNPIAPCVSNVDSGTVPATLDIASLPEENRDVAYRFMAPGRFSRAVNGGARDSGRGRATGPPPRRWQRPRRRAACCPCAPGAASAGTARSGRPTAAAGGGAPRPAPGGPPCPCAAHRNGGAPAAARTRRGAPARAAHLRPARGAAAGAGRRIPSGSAARTRRVTVRGSRTA